MPEIVKRGYVPSDEVEFAGFQLTTMQAAQKDIAYLINRGYGLEKAVTFVGNRHMFSKRQRMALTRATVSEGDLGLRRKKTVLTSKTVHIDGFNVIITLEAVLSHSTILLCMDDAIRDLCGLHGTYRIIDKTAAAIDCITRRLASLNVTKAIYYLDKPVSNSGRLKQLIEERSKLLNLNVEVRLTKNPDSALWNREHVISSDAIVLNRCVSWMNLVKDVILEYTPDVKWVDLSLASP